MWYKTDQKMMQIDAYCIRLENIKKNSILDLRKYVRRAKDLGGALLRCSSAGFSFIRKWKLAEECAPLGLS